MELRQLLQVLWRRRRVFLGLSLGIFIGVMALTLLVIPRYVATSKVLFYKSPSATTLMTTMGLRTAGAPESVSDAELANYKEIALSRPVMQRVVRDMELKRLRARAIIPRMVPGATMVLPRIGLGGFLNATKPLLWDELGKKSALQFFFPRPYVDIQEDQDADVYSITVQTTDMQQSVDIANAVAQAFIDREIELQREEYYRFGDTIEARLPLAKAEYDRTLAAMQRFQEQNGSVSLDDEVARFISQLYLIYQQRDESTVEAERTKAVLAETLRKLEATPRYSRSQTQFERNPVIDSIKLTLRDLYLELANTKTRYTDQHPTVIDIQNRIQQARDIIQEEAASVYGSTIEGQDPLYTELAQRAAEHAAEATGYEVQAQAYDAVIKEWEGMLSSFPALQREYATLDLHQRRAEQYYQVLTDMRYQVDTARSLAVSHLRLMEAAAYPPDVKDYRRPKLSFHMALAILLSGFFSLTGTFLREYLDHTVQDGNDAATAAGVPCLGVLPPLDAKAAAASFDLPPGHPYREAATGVAAALALPSQDDAPHLLGMLPLDDAAGAALAMGHIGRVLALDAHGLCLVDCALQTPQLHLVLHGEPVPGVADVLGGTHTVQSAMQPLFAETASFMAAGVATSATFLTPSALRPILQGVRLACGQALVNLPVLSTSADALRVASLLDATLLVATQGVTSREALARAVSQVTQAGGVVRGVIVTQRPRRRSVLQFPRRHPN